MGLLDRLFGRKATPKREHAGDDMISLVVLSQSCPDITLDSLRTTLDSIFAGEFLPPREEGNFVIDGAVPGATYLIQCNVSGSRGMFMLHNVAGPYKEFSDFASYLPGEIGDLALGQPYWMSIDVLHAHGSKDEAYDFIAKVLAQLAPPDAGVLLHPSKMAATEFTQEVRRQLASGDTSFGNA